MKIWQTWHHIISKSKCKARAQLLARPQMINRRVRMRNDQCANKKKHRQRYRRRERTILEFRIIFQSKEWKKTLNETNNLWELITNISTFLFINFKTREQNAPQNSFSIRCGLQIKKGRAMLMAIFKQI